MPFFRRPLILTMICAMTLAACGAGGPINGDGDGNGNLGNGDTLALTSYTPAAAPAASALPITFTLNFHYDLETAASGTITAGYRVTPGAIIQTTSVVHVSRGAGSSAVSFSLPASALTSTALGVAVTLTDSTGAILAQDIATVPRS
jgi:hypothetical protein